MIKKSIKDPWNNVSQAKNTKCESTFPPPSSSQLTNPHDAVVSFNPDFWASRVNMPDPRAAFLQEGKDDAGVLARAKARKLSKEDTVAH